MRPPPRYDRLPSLLEALPKAAIFGTRIARPPPVLAQEHDVEVLEGLGPLLSLRSEWNALAEHQATPLVRHEWFAACARVFYRRSQLRTLVIRRGRELRAAVPLARVRLGASPKLSLVGGSPFHGEPSALLYDGEPSSLSAVLRGLLGLGGAVLFDRLALSTAEAALLYQECRGRSLVRLVATPGSPWLDTSGTWARFQDAQGSRRRSDLRRARRRAQALGEVTIEMLRPDAADVPALIEKFFAVESRSWKGRQTDSTQELFQRFFHTYASAMGELGVLRVARLRLDGRPVACQLGIEHARRYWVLKVAYDEEFKRCSPEILLMQEVVRDAFERLDAVEFLGGDAPWIHTWTRTMHPYYTVKLYPFSFGGMTALGRDAAARTTAGALQRIGRVARASA